MFIWACIVCCSTLTNYTLQLLLFNRVYSLCVTSMWMRVLQMHPCVVCICGCIRQSLTVMASTEFHRGVLNAMFINQHGLPIINVTVCLVCILLITGILEKYDLLATLSSGLNPV
jgi:hypothetical protein